MKWYGNWMVNDECPVNKREFLGMPNGTSGRVRLTDVHKAAFEGHGRFREKAEYFRKAGALDESDPDVPIVLLPNLIIATSNCLGTTSFFDQCCPNECEPILELLEKKLQAPEVAPADVTALLSQHTSAYSDSEFSKRSLMSSLTGFSAEKLLPPLQDIARSHGGRVHMHGFAFAEWLHSAFPRECPRPRTRDFTRSAARAGHEEEDEVPGSGQKFQDVATFESLSDFEATKGELLYNACNASSSPKDCFQAVAAEFNLGDDFNIDLLNAKMLSDISESGSRLAAPDITSFAQTGLQVDGAPVSDDAKQEI
jgi:hypothetical protein